MNNTSSPWMFGHCRFDQPLAWLDAFLYIFIAFIAGSGSLIVFVCYSRHRALRSSTNVFIISLSASDLMVACVSIPYSFGVFLCQWRPREDNRTLEDLVYLTCDMIPSILSIYSLCFIAIDRVFAVLNPFFYTKYVNQKTAGISVAVMWAVVVSLVAFIYILERHHFTLFIIFLSYILPVIVMISCYSIMGYLANQHSKAISIMEKTSLRLLERTNSESFNDRESKHGNDADNEGNHSNDGKSIKNERMGSLKWLRQTFRRTFSQDDGRTSEKHEGLNFLKREFKAALTLSLLLGVFVATWTPFMALNMESYRCPSCHIDFHLVKYFKILHYSNSAMNPLLYIILNKRWRAAFQIMIFCVQKRARVSEVTMSELAAW